MRQEDVIVMAVFYYGFIGFSIGLIPFFFALYYNYSIEKENRELKALLRVAHDKLQTFLAARRKGAMITNSRRKK